MPFYSIYGPSPSVLGVDFYPKVPLADGDEDRRLRDGVGAEVVQLHSVVFAHRPHESADGNAESPLVEPHEAHDVALGGFGLVSSVRGGIHDGRSELLFIRSSLSATSCSKTATVAEDFPHGNGTWTSDIASNRRGMRGSKPYDG